MRKRTCVVPVWLHGCGPDITDAEDRCRDIMGRVRVMNDALPLESITCMPGVDGVRIDVEIAVPDRGDLKRARPMAIVSALTVPWDPILQNGPSHLIREIRRMVRDLVAHEVDESFLIDDERVFDPHRPLLSGE